MTFEQILAEFLALAENLGSAIVMALLVLVLYWLALRLLNVVEQKKRLASAVVFVTRRGLKWIVAIALVLAVLHCFGILGRAWAAITGVLALVAIGFVAVWSVLSNTLCSVILMLTRPFSIGDTVEITPDGLRGKVVNFTMLFTTLRAEDGDLIHIPNNLFFQKAVRCDVGKQTISLDEQLMRQRNADEKPVAGEKPAPQEAAPAVTSSVGSA